MTDAASPAIIGLAGASLAPEEAAVIARHRPAGIILFRRNIEDPNQLARLVADLRAVLPAGAVLMVDQEGGRVARLRPPHWRAHKAAAAIGALHARDAASGREAAFATGALIGLETRDAGFDVVASPVLDLAVDRADPVIGDRAYGADPDTVIALAGEVAAGLLAAGIQPIGKHAPGHGRAAIDSHLALPVLDDISAPELEPFRALAGRIPWMMTAHILYRRLDPERPATISPVIIARIIRGEIGFAGVLVSDDLSMGALDGSPGTRGAAALAAGCDLALLGSGVLAETVSLLEAIPRLADAGRRRLAEAASRAEAARRVLDPERLARDAARA